MLIFFWQKKEVKFMKNFKISNLQKILSIQYTLLSVNHPERFIIKVNIHKIVKYWKLKPIQKLKLELGLQLKVKDIWLEINSSIKVRFKKGVVMGKVDWYLKKVMYTKDRLKMENLMEKEN